MKKINSLISVIICTYNRCESLQDTLESLLRQELNSDFDFEIIVIDNNSFDRTRDVIYSYIPRFNSRLRYLFEQERGKAYALNRGIKESIGEIIAFTDDDVIVDEKWLLNVWRYFQENNCDGIGGRVLPLYPHNTPRWIKRNKDFLSGPIVCHDYGEEIKIYEKFSMEPFTGANMAIKKECFLDCGFFNKNLGPGKGVRGEDTELFEKLAKRGKSIFYCGKSIVWHKLEKKRMNLAYIVKWFIDSGRCVARIEKENESTLLCYFGIPRYILKKLIKDIIIFPLILIKKEKVFAYIKRVCVDIGRCLEYIGFRYAKN